MSDAVDVGAMAVPGGYFLISHTRVLPFLGGQSTRRPRVVFTYQPGCSDIRSALVEMIRSAQTKVFVASFRIGDAEVLQALEDAAERLTGGVYVISALDDASLRKGIEKEDETDEATDAQNKRFEALTRKGIYLRGHESCHAKFAVVDDKVALVSSANFETRAFDVTGEFGIVTEDQKDTAALARLFAHLWHQGCTFELPPGRRDYAVTKRVPVPSPCAYPAAVEPPRDGVIWTESAQHGILSHLHDIIDGARNELDLATFSLCDNVAHPELLLDPVRRARARGVNVRILVRGRNNIRTHRDDATALARSGVHVYADTRNHAKAAIADRKRGAVFSANFDAQHGLTSGVEVGMRLSGKSIVEGVLAFLDHSMQSADLKFALDPTHAALDRGLAVGWKARWPLVDPTPVKVTAPDWKRFIAETACGPVVWWKSADGIVLAAGATEWHLGDGAEGQARTLSLRRQGCAVTSAGILDDWLQSPSRGGGRASGGDRGICSGSFEAAEVVDSDGEGQRPKVAAAGKAVTSSRARIKRP